METLAYVLLGLLVDSGRSAYSLRHELSRSTHPERRVSANVVHPVLERLSKRGWVRATPTPAAAMASRRDSIFWEITEAGRASFETWLNASEALRMRLPYDMMSDGFLARLLFLNRMPAQQALMCIRSERLRTRLDIEYLERMLARRDTPDKLVVREIVELAMAAARARRHLLRELLRRVRAETLPDAFAGEQAADRELEASSSVPEVVLRAAALPAALGDLEAPPAELYVRGELPRGPAVAIVGTRRPTDGGRRFARKLATELAEAGVAVLSGGAEGIDTEAHAGALDAGGRTVVVAGAGFDRPFPVQNAGLFRSIVDAGGAYASLVPAEVPAERFRFLIRNGVLAALAHIVVVVQAPIRSGARSAAAHARRLGRPLFVTPGAPFSRAGAGCAEELRLGARPLVRTEQLLHALAQARLHPIVGPRRGPGTQSIQEMLPLFSSSTSPPGRGP